jgi:tripartite-type tricarboxylate transporter receptor subunit TctC
MNFPTRRACLKGAAAALLLEAVHPASLAQPAAWPTRPIRLVVPFPAGGASDIVMRLLAEKLTTELGQQVVVDNRPGAASLIGVQAAVNSPADGYTILMGSTASLVTNQFLYKKLPYDPASFEPIALVAVQPMVVVAHPSVPAASVAELMAYAKAHDGELSYASFGTGTQSHLALEMLNIRAGTRMTHIPYKGAAEALPALVGGSVQLYTDAVSTSLPYIKSGAVKALGVTSAQRSVALPQVPTIAEQGFSGFDMAPWIALVALKGTPPDVLARLRHATGAVLASAAVVERMASLGQEIPQAGGGAAALTAQIQSDRPKLAKLLKDVHIEPQ